jgi:hypothetical protein
VIRWDPKELFEKLVVNLSRLISICFPVVGFKVTSYRTPFPINREASLYFVYAVPRALPIKRNVLIEKIPSPISHLGSNSDVDISTLETRGKLLKSIFCNQKGSCSLKLRTVMCS